MPHQNTSSANATSQNAAQDPDAPRDQADATDRRDEPRSYAAGDVADASLAAPAAGEMSDYADDGEALGADDVQQGGTHANRPERTEAALRQGPKTLQANRERLRGH